MKEPIRNRLNLTGLVDHIKQQGAITHNAQSLKIIQENFASVPIHTVLRTHVQYRTSYYKVYKFVHWDTVRSLTGGQHNIEETANNFMLP